MDRTMITLFLLIFFFTSSAMASAIECPEGTQIKKLNFPEMSIAMCENSEGVLHGPAISSYPSGAVYSKDFWLDGKKHGTWQEFDETGTLRKEEIFETGEIHGTSTFFYPNGNTQNITHYQNGTRNGSVEEWSENGLQTVAGQFKMGKPFGAWFFVNPTSHFLHSTRYLEGEEVSTDILFENTTCNTWQSATKVQKKQFITDLGLLLVNDTQDQTHKIERSVNLGLCINEKSSPLVSLVKKTCDTYEGTFLKSELSNKLREIIVDCALKNSVALTMQSTGRKMLLMFANKAY